MKRFLMRIGWPVIIISLLLPISSRLAPIVREKDTYLTCIDKERFLAKLQRPLPLWASNQIQEDLSDFQNQKITENSLNVTFQEVQRKAKNKTSLLRYRILDNRLYKYAEEGPTYSDGTSEFEKAFITLSCLCRLPDVDFIICPMDGIPEAYMPPDFILVDHPEEQAPLFGKAKITGPTTSHIVLIPDQFSLSTEWYKISQDILALNEQMPWETKKEIAFWRGSLTDMGVPNEVFTENFQRAPRFLLSLLSQQFPQWIDAGISAYEKSYEKPLQEMKVIRSGASRNEHLLYKYQLVLDGHMCTYPGYQWRLLSNALVLKQESNQIQWFYSALLPYQDYIPISNDMSDLITKIQWAKNHDPKAQSIVDRAQNFAKSNLMIEDNYLYLYSTLKEYALSQDIDFKKLKAETKRDPKWCCIHYQKRTKFLVYLLKKWKTFLNFITNFSDDSQDSVQKGFSCVGYRNGAALNDFVKQLPFLEEKC